jgi:hypothetical protein
MALWIVTGIIVVCMLCVLFTAAVVVGSTKAKGRHRSEGFFPNDYNEWGGSPAASGAEVPCVSVRSADSEPAVPGTRESRKADGSHRRGSPGYAARHVA